MHYESTVQQLVLHFFLLFAYHLLTMDHLFYEKLTYSFQLCNSQCAKGYCVKNNLGICIQKLSNSDSLLSLVIISGMFTKRKKKNWLASLLVQICCVLLANLSTCFVRVKIWRSQRMIFPQCWRPESQKTHSPVLI